MSKIIKPKIISQANILIYDKENIKYIKGNMVSYDTQMDYITYESINGDGQYFPNGATITISTSNDEELENIELDATTMKRIAKYNKETECKRLDEEIKKKQAQIKELDEKLTDKEKRWKKIKEYVANIYEIDLDDDDYDDFYD